MKRVLKLHFDGGARGNPGPAGAGAVLTFAGKRVAYAWRWLEKQTNNEAEYNALGLGLYHANRCTLRFDTLEVLGDSKLVLEQTFGSWKCNHEHLEVLRDQCQLIVQSLAAKGVKVTARHVPREQNAEADTLANNAIDTKKHGFESGDALAEPRRVRAPRPVSARPIKKRRWKKRAKK